MVLVLFVWFCAICCGCCHHAIPSHASHVPAEWHGWLHRMHDKVLHVTRHASHVTRHASHVTRHTLQAPPTHAAEFQVHNYIITTHPLFVKSTFARNSSHVTHHTSHVTLRTSQVTRHTSHVKRHTSHVTLHTSHVTRHTSRAIAILTPLPETFFLSGAQEKSHGSRSFGR